MNMQQFTGWLTRLLHALPWRHARRPAKQPIQARVTSTRGADRFAVSDPKWTRRPKADTNPLCSTLNEDAPPRRDTLPPTQPPPLPAADSEPPSAPLLALPAPASSPQDSPGEAAQAVAIQVDPERRLAFARYLVRRGTFNEGFSREKLPAQYRRTQQDECQP
jgi:hypothetical protein